MPPSQGSGSDHRVGFLCHRRRPSALRGPCASHLKPDRLPPRCKHRLTQWLSCAELTSIRYWSAPRPLATPPASHTRSRSRPPLSCASQRARDLQLYAPRLEPLPHPKPSLTPSRPTLAHSQSTCSTPTSRRPTTTFRVRNAPLQLLNAPKPTHPPWPSAADDRSKNLRPKRNIRTAMNHGAQPFATFNPRFRRAPAHPVSRWRRHFRRSCVRANDGQVHTVHRRGT